MKARQFGWILLPAAALLGLLSGCAVQHYRPAPLVPARTAAQIENRNLRNTGLRRYMAKALGHPVAWPMQRWDLQTLTLAALYFSPQMKIARDQVAVAQGGVVTAGEHPNPTFSLRPGIPSPWILDMPLAFPIETHGKRALRIEEAKDLTSAARISLGQTEWTVATGVRKALLAYEMANAQLALSHATERNQSRQVKLLSQRLAAGEGARPALQAAQLALSNLQFATSVDEGQTATTRAALASVIGLPVAALAGVQINWPNFTTLPAIASLSAARIQRDAVLNRLDVRAALKQYAAADADLRLQLARQYPNFNIGPGYSFEEGNNYFTVPFSMVLPIRNRNQGPIAQAEAMRKEAAANFMAVQARAIAQSQQALAAYRSALAELNQASRPLQNQNRQVRMTTRAVAEGESNRLQLNTLVLQGAVFSRQRLQALGSAQAALGDLENAVERPLAPGEFSLAAPSSPNAGTAAASKAPQTQR